MHSRQQRTLQALRRMEAWCAANPAFVPPPDGAPETRSSITRQLAAISTVVSEVTAAASVQAVSGSRVTLEATGEAGLREHLRQEMRSVTQVAQALKDEVPGISILRMPSSKTQAEGLLKAAEAFIALASTFEAELVAHAVPSDFVKQLQDAVSALQVSIDGRGAARAGQVSATEQMAVSLRLGMKAVKILDAALTRALRSDPAKLAEWRNARRITIKGVSNPGDFSLPADVTPVAAASPATPPAVASPGTIAEPSGKAA